MAKAKAAKKSKKLVRLPITNTIADGDFDPANWGKAYPHEYDLWLKTTPASGVPYLVSFGLLMFWKWPPLRVVVPGYQPLYRGHRLRALGGSRLYEVPRKLGYRGIARGQGGNPAPHPFF